LLKDVLNNFHPLLVQNDILDLKLNILGFKISSLHETVRRCIFRFN
jgi:hypothetical protein